MTLRDRFLLVERASEGGLAAVYRAEDAERPGSDAAVKVLHAVYASVPEVRLRFTRETELAFRLGARIGAAGRASGFINHGDTARPFIAVDFIVGVTLKERLRTLPYTEPVFGRETGFHAAPLSARESVELAMALLERLAFMHDDGFAHRDLKPANVLLARASQGSDGGNDSDDSDHSDHNDDCDVRLLDLDAAAPFRAGEPTADDLRSGVPQTSSGPGVLHGSLALGRGLLTQSAHGSPAYTAPEQWLAGAAPDPRADLYSVGAILFEMLCGRRPFIGNPIELLDAHAQRQPPRLRTLRPALSPALDDLVVMSLEKDPSRRFQSARAMRAALAEVPEHAPCAAAAALAPLSEGHRP